jgi:hypothetical protein
MRNAKEVREGKEKRREGEEEDRSKKKPETSETAFLSS